MRLILFGPPGVGKGTQAQLLAERYKVPHISTGDILRNAIAGGSDLGRRAETYVVSGGLVPDDLMIGIVHDALAEPLCKNGFILDGFPRTVPQAESLEEIFHKLQISLPKVLDIEANEGELVERLTKRGRVDDTQATISNRLNVYNSATAPVKEYYKKLGRLKVINGVGDINDIHQSIVMLLGNGQ